MKYHDADDDAERRPVRRKPRRVRCTQRGCRRDIVRDSDHWDGEFIHADTLLYQCDPSDKRMRMATAP